MSNSQLQSFTRYAKIIRRMQETAIKRKYSMQIVGNKLTHGLIAADTMLTVQHRLDNSVNDDTITALERICHEYRIRYRCDGEVLDYRVSPVVLFFVDENSKVEGVRKATNLIKLRHVVKTTRVDFNINHALDNCTDEQINLILAEI